ncbi:MAG: ORF6N domain-containing protein [Chitinophagaceae bacterium]
MNAPIIENKIYEVRGQEVMLDFDLAELYQTETNNLKRSVRQNVKRFPTDFMFELTKDEYELLRCNFSTLKDKESSKRGHPRM